MARILVRGGAFQPSTKNILRNTDKRRKGPVIKRMRKGVTGVEVHIFACRLVHLQRAAVIDGISGEIVATDQTRGKARNAIVKVLAGRIVRRWRDERASRKAGILPARDS